MGIIHVKSGGSRGIDGCLALIRIEGGRDGNDNIVQVRLMQNLLSLVHQISQNLCGYVRRSFIFNSPARGTDSVRPISDLTDLQT